MNKRILLIDGNSILNRAFYGIMSSKMLTAPDGTPTNATYGFLSIYFKTLEEILPDYVAVAFDLRAPTFRHKMYDAYKGTRTGMPDELAVQMPMIKDVLRKMNVTIIEKEGYEADDILGTYSKLAEKEGLDAIILTGDRDSFQLVSKNITINLPRTKAGKTETETIDEKAIEEKYGLEPIKLIEVKGLMGDPSDNIPGVPSVGEKTALKLIKEYGTIENLYKELKENKNINLTAKLKEKLIENEDMAILSKALGTIDTNMEVELPVEELKLKEWNVEETLAEFQKLKFNRFIERFNMSSESKENIDDFELEFSKVDIENDKEIEDLKNAIIKNQEIYYLFHKENNYKPDLIVKKDIKAITINLDNKLVYIYLNTEKQLSKFLNIFKEIFEDDKIKKYSYKIKEDYIILKEDDVHIKNMYFDIEIAAYLIDMNKGKYVLSNLIIEFLGIEYDAQINKLKEEYNIEDVKKQKQITLFDVDEIIEEVSNAELKPDVETLLSGYYIIELVKILKKKLEELDQWKLFEEMEMPLAKTLAKMQWTGMFVDKNLLIETGVKFKEIIETLTKSIYELAGEEFNIRSPKQLGEVLFEKLKLPTYKKTKSGYSTGVEVLEKLQGEHPIIEKILEYRQITKLDSTYVEGLLQYINKKTKRVHSFFNQTITATGRISSTEPNLQNIPTRTELGKEIRKFFVCENDNQTLIDADYSQIELRVLASISADETMIDQFNNDADIHTQTASTIFKVPIDEVTSTLRSQAKAVNFGIVYGITDFGLAGNIGIGRKEAKTYIEEYLKHYPGIQKFMDDIIKKADEEGFVETLFNRRRYIPELKSKNYMIRQFGNRVALNTPIQGTAADIIKIAMINIDKELENRNLKSKLILQVHDELIIEALESEKEEVKKILKEFMENAIDLKVPLKADIEEGKSWFVAK